jgi:RNA polymerase primary sigma factor
MSGTVGHDDGVGLQAYFNDISKSKPLTRERERELALRIKDGDGAARDELAQANLLFVISVAKKYQNRGLTLSELISAGNVGLMTAVDRFDPSRGYKFISYAVWWIRQSILQTLAEEVRTVHLPLNRISLLRKISKAWERLGGERGEDPDMAAVAADLDVSVDEVEDTVLSGRQVYSLDKEFQDDDERSLMTTLADQNQESPDAQVLRSANQTHLEDVLASLDERELRIVRLYYGLDGGEPLTLEQIGDLMALTRERIRQIKESAFAKLRREASQAAAGWQISLVQ